MYFLHLFIHSSLSYHDMVLLQATDSLQFGSYMIFVQSRELLELFQPDSELEQQQAKLPGSIPAYAPSMPGQLCQQPLLFRLMQKFLVMCLPYILI
jgi:hypothetical protein